MMKPFLRLMLAMAISILSTAPTHAEDQPAAAKDEWDTLVAGFEGLGRLTQKLSNPQDPQLRHELYKYMVSAAAQGYLGLLYADAQHPDWYPSFSPAFNFAGPNPDNVYYITPIDDTGVYRVSGDRGTVHIIDFNLGSGDLQLRGTGTLGPTMANYDLDETVKINQDGTFEVILSAERPDGHTGNWWKLVPGSNMLMVRQLSYDALKEVDGRLAIERLDVAVIKPRTPAERAAENLALVSKWTENWTIFNYDWLKRLEQQGLVNKLIARDLNAAGGYTKQIYVEGVFDLAPDEALIIETTIPKTCRYWNVQLTDEKFSAIDILNRQTWLNGRSARLDADGKFRAVVSAQDPGVPNWLDTAGYRKGEILGRWNNCDGAPAPSAAKVAFADVRKHLPSDTPTVTATQREEAIRLRRKGLQLRKRW
jgi:Protein of unknown function (DUF1214)